MENSQWYLGPIIFHGSDLWDIQVFYASDISPLLANRGSRFWTAVDLSDVYNTVTDRTKGNPKWEVFQLESALQASYNHYRTHNFIYIYIYI